MTGPEPGPVVLVFLAPWCGPCHRLEPLLDEVAAGHRSTVRVEKVRVDREPALVEQFGVRATPTIVVQRGDEELARSVGAVSRAELDRLFAMARTGEPAVDSVGRGGHRADAALRLGAGASLLATGLLVGPHLLLVVIGMLVLASAGLALRGPRPTGRSAAAVSGSMR